MADGVGTSPQTQRTASPSITVIVQPGLAARTFWYFRQALIAAYEDNCFSIAKGAAYSFLLSLFPILTTLTSILVQVRGEAVVHVMATFMSQIVPPGTEDIVLSHLRERGAKPISLPVVAILVSLWAGSGAMMSLMEGFQAVYRIPSGRPFVKQRLMAIFLVLIAAVPAVGASSLIIIGDRGAAGLAHWLGLSAPFGDLSRPVQVLWRVARYILAFCTTTLVTGLLYYFGANHRPEPASLQGVARSRFFRVWPGAFLATFLWLGVTAGFAWYVAHLANYNVFYGSIGTVIVLLIWMYLMACISLVGCEFNAERERVDALPLAHS